MQWLHAGGYCLQSVRRMLEASAFTPLPVKLHIPLIMSKIIASKREQQRGRGLGEDRPGEPRSDENRVKSVKARWRRATENGERQKRVKCRKRERRMTKWP